MANMTIPGPFGKSHLTKQGRLDPMNIAQLRSRDTWRDRSLHFKRRQFFIDLFGGSPCKTGADLTRISNGAVFHVAEIKRADRAKPRLRRAEADDYEFLPHQAFGLE